MPKRWLVLRNDLEQGPVVRVVFSDEPPEQRIDRRTLRGLGGAFSDFPLIQLSGPEQLVFRLITDNQNHSSKGRFVQRTKEQYAALIQELGGKCVFCGSTERLEVHHPNGRGYEARKLSSTRRMRKYIEEHKAGVKLQAACKWCNSREH